MMLGFTRASKRLVLAALVLCILISVLGHGALAADDAPANADSKASDAKAEPSPKAESSPDTKAKDSSDAKATSTNKGSESSDNNPDNRDLSINVGGNSNSNTNAISLGSSNPSPSASSDNLFGISLNNNNSDSPSKTSSGSKATSSSSSSSSNGQPGRIVMKTPPQSVESPLFETASKVKLQWDYDNNMKKPPSKITIRGQMPPGYVQPGTNKPLYWYIAQNVSASSKSYIWDTITESPPGYTLKEGTGYKMYIYDGDIGWENSTHVYPGKLFQFMLPFSMYNSRYAQSNDGVPKNYNPNAGSRSVSVAAGLWTALVAAVLATFAL
ncbi:hypothetical protein GGI07_004848 [Coemansia sp. Benny D115]|nr:hypothetical protein GGI07_004848 [Coemansia sp. Benny D115]